MGMNDSDLRFRADLEDKATPQLDKLVTNLKKAGATTAEIKMFIRAYDEATPRIKEARKHMLSLPKEHIFQMKANADAVIMEHQRFKRSVESKPIRLTFVDNLEEVSQKLFNLRTKVALPMMGSIPGANMLYGVGAGAAIAGPLTALTGLIEKSVQINSSMEQSMVTLQQTLKDQTVAQKEMGKLVGIAQTTPFQYQDVLQADVRLRSYGIPSMKGEGGPGNKGWLNSAGDMAAALNTPISQAVEAIADARQGYFVRMMSYGIRMMREDFQAGGKFAGLTYEQGLERAIRRFEGAQEMQSKTFQGVTSNLKDIMQQSILKPFAAPIFAKAESSANALQDKLIGTTPEAIANQQKLAAAIEKVQMIMQSMLTMVGRGKAYFEENLQKPLEEFGKKVFEVGKTFTNSFGRVFLEVAKTILPIFMSLSKALADFANAHPELVKVYAVMKAMSVLGFHDPQNGLEKIKSSIFSLHPSIFRLISGFTDLSKAIVKVGFFAILHQFEKAKAATEELHNSLKKIGKDDGFDDLNQKIALTALLTGQTSTNLKHLTAMGISGGLSPNNALRQATAAPGFSQYGLKSDQAMRLMLNEENVRKVGVDEANSSLRGLAKVVDELGMSMSKAITVMDMMSSQTSPLGLNTAAGNSGLLSMLDKAGVPNFLNKAQIGQHINTPMQLLQTMYSSYASPSSPDLAGMTPQQLERYYTLKPGRGGQGRKLLQDYYDTSRANVRAFRADQDWAHNIDPNLNLPNSLIGTNMAFNPKQLQGKSQHDQLGLLMGANTRNEQEFKNLPKQLTDIAEAQNHYNAEVARMSVLQGQAGIATAEFQQSLVGLQRKIEDLQLATAEYSFEHLRPLEREMNRVSHAASNISNAMTNAQYSMSKFSDGLVTGEQSALDQLHALDLFNKQLQLLQLNYTQIGQQLGKNYYQRGFSTHIAPLEGLSLENQMQKLQMEQQRKQLEYDATFGEDHYQMQQAGRSRNQRREMSFEDRMDGIKKNAHILDNLNVQQHNLSQVQNDLQNRMFDVNETIADQQDKMTGLQMRLQKLQQSKYMRQLTDDQALLNIRTQIANVHLVTLNSQLASLQDKLSTQLPDQRKSLGNWIRSFLDFSATDTGSQFKRINDMIDEQVQVGTIKPKQAAMLHQAVQKAEEIYRNEKSKGPVSGAPQSATDWIKVIKQGVWGTLTGDTWRNLGNLIHGVPGIGPIASSSPATVLATGATAAMTAAVATGIITHLVRQGAIRPLAAAIGAALPGTMLGRGATRLGELAAGGGFWKGLGEQFRLLMRSRAWAGGLAGSALGGFIGGPAGSVLGGMLGARWGGRGSYRGAVEDVSKAAKTIKNASEKAGEVVQDAKKAGIVIADKHGRIVEDFKKAETRLGGHVRRFGRAGGRIGGAAAVFTVASELFKSTVGRLVGDLKDLFPHHSARTPSDTAKKLRAGDDAAEAAEKELKTNSAFRKGVDAAASRGEKYIRYGGQALRIVSRGAGALSFAPAVADLAQGHVKKSILEAANAGTYFIPGIGEGRIFSDLLGGVGQAHTRGYADPRSASLIRGAYAQNKRLLGYYGDQGGHGNVSENEAKVLVDNTRRQVEIANRLQDDRDKMSTKQYKDLVDKLEKMQKQYNDDFNVATKSGTDSARKILTDHLTETTKDRATYHSKTLGDVKLYYDDLSKVEDKGQDGLFKQTDKYLVKLHRRLNATARSLGITLDPGDTTGNAAGGKDKFGPNYAAGGIAKHIIKGIGDGKGYLARVGEEGDEVIIPLAAHRRDRAKNLLSHASAMIGMNHGNYANGGTTDPAYQVARNAYMTARGFASGGFTGPFGSLAGFIPVSNFAKSKFGLSATAGRDNHNYLTASGNVSDHSWGGAVDYSNKAGDGNTKSSETPQEWAFARFFVNKLPQVVKQIIFDNTILAGGSQGSAVPGHMNHVHLALLPQYARNSSVMAKLLSRASEGLNIDALLKAGSFGTGLGEAAMPQWEGKIPNFHHGVAGRLVRKALQRMKHLYNSTAGGGSNLDGFHGGGDASANRALGKRMAAAFGWKGQEWSALDRLWTGESGWINQMNHEGSGAGGIPQALPMNKMASAGSDWRTNVATQIKWGLGYIKSSYQDPIRAYAKWLSRSPHWYAQGTGPSGFTVTSPMAAIAAHQGEHVTIENPSQVTSRRKLNELIEQLLDQAKKILKRMPDESKSKKSRDTDHLADLNARLRQAYAGKRLGASSAAAGSKNLMMAIHAMGDESDGENTSALVQNEHVQYNTQIRNAIRSSKVIKKAQAAGRRAHKRVRTLVKKAKSKHSPGGRKVTRRERLGIVRAREHAKTADHHTRVVRARVKGRATGKYLGSAAARGVSPALIKAITGRKMSKEELTIYNKMQAAIKNGAKTNSADVKKMRSQLVAAAKKAELTTLKHSNTEKKYRADMKKLHTQEQKLKGAEKKKDRDHQKKTEDHQKKVEGHLAKIAKLDLNVNITNVSKGKIATTVKKARAR